jgi:hypothetical protein
VPKKAAQPAMLVAVRRLDRRVFCACTTASRQLGTPTLRLALPPSCKRGICFEHESRQHATLSPRGATLAKLGRRHLRC